MKRLHHYIHIFFLCVCLSLMHTPAFGSVDGIGFIVKGGMIGGAAGLMGIGAVSCCMFTKGLEFAACAPGNKKRYMGWALIGVGVALPIITLVGISRLLKK